MSSWEVGYYVGSSRDHVDGKHEGYSLVDALGRGFITHGGSSDVSAYGELYLGLEVCYPGSFTNGKFYGNLGGSPLIRVLGAEIGSERVSSSGMSYVENLLRLNAWWSTGNLCWICYLNILYKAHECTCNKSRDHACWVIN